MASSLAKDPRRADKIVPFHMPPAVDGEADVNANIALYAGMASIFIRNRFKIVPWVAAYFGVSSLLNSRKSVKSKDSPGFTGIMVAFISLFTYYLNIYMVNKKTHEAVAAGEAVFSN
ncbi:uncharacterized protein BYT42DRAFT_574820 [Radiomyces spectabilis]|uniref:uncharacterized protein n=1 Tax=Radiomyces spectabilis TaxID=64574 RepID=UPI00221FAD0C|nr:uncharacterized protein BYT42DRAFT_574820 [Radiomyces spectabilis]KAI8376496.1 hypothetical protein BYT42DRAFT_574820 [Radiomyces spectabilis]